MDTSTSVEHTPKRQRRTPKEKREIVEATLLPGASVARVAREHGVNANMFRDTFAVRLMQAGVSIDVAILLGHSNISVTQRSYHPWVKSQG